MKRNTWKKSSYLKNVNNLYKGMLDQYFEKYKDEVLNKPFDQAFLNKFIDYIGTDVSVLDLGCGPTCQQARFISGKANVKCIDVVLENVEYAKSKFPNIDVEQMDLCSLGFGDCEFDGAFAYYSLGHIPFENLHNALRGIHRVLRPSGLFAMVVHEGEHDGFHESDDVYFKSFSLNEVKESLRHSGFELIDIETRDPFYSDESGLRRIYAIGRKL